MEDQNALNAWYDSQYGPKHPYTPSCCSCVAEPLRVDFPGLKAAGTGIKNALENPDLSPLWGDGSGLQGSQKRIRKIITELENEMEEQIMKVTYKTYAKEEERTYTGELIKLEMRTDGVFPMPIYRLTLRLEDGATVSFERVRLEDLAFSGGRVVFGE